MADKKHNFTRTEIVAGALVITAGLVLAFFVGIAIGWRPQAAESRYYAKFHNIAGLNDGAEVRFGGVIVGFVDRIEPDPNDRSMIEVAVLIDGDTPVNTESVATVEQVTLTAAKHVEISTGAADAELLPSGETLRSVTKTGGFIDLPDLTDLVAGAEEMLDDVITFLGVDKVENEARAGGPELVDFATIARDLKTTLGESEGLLTDLRNVVEEQKPTIEEALERLPEIEKSAQELLDKLSDVLDENREPLNETLKGAQALVEDARGAVEDVAAIFEGLDDKLEGIIAALERTLANTESMTGEADDFLKDNRPAIEAMVKELRGTLQNMDDLLRTLAEQPQSIIRGRQPQGRN